MKHVVMDVQRSRQNINLGTTGENGGKQTSILPSAEVGTKVLPPAIL